MTVVGKSTTVVGKSAMVAGKSVAVVEKSATVFGKSAMIATGAPLDGPISVGPFSANDSEAAMSVLIPDEILESARMSESELRQELAVVLFEKDRLTLAQASGLAGMDRLRFQHLLASRGIPVHYDVEDFEEDLATLRDLRRL